MRQTMLDAPRSYFAHYGFGVMAFRQGRRAEGESELRAAIAIVPHDPEVHVELANRYRDGGLCGPAIPLYQEALRMSPAHPDARSGLVICQLREARFLDARSNAIWLSSSSDFLM